MRAFTWGLVIGIVAVGIVGAAWAGAGPDVLARALGRSTLDHVDGATIAIGRFTMESETETTVAVLVFAPRTAADALLADAGLYRVSDAAVDPTGGKLCPADVCPLRTGEERLQQDVRSALLAHMPTPGAAAWNSSGWIRTDAGDLLVFSVARVPAPTALNASAEERLQQIEENLQEACGGGAGNVPPACADRYVRFHVRAWWDASWSAWLKDARPDEAAVLGPLAWRTERLEGPPLQVGTPLFLPTSALGIALVVVAIAALAQEALELWGRNPFLPLPPLSMIAAAFFLLRVHGIGHDVDVWNKAFVVFGVGLFLWLCAYRLLDMIGVQYLTVLSTAATLVLAGVAFVADLKAVVLVDPAVLLATFYTSAASEASLHVASRTLAVVVGVSAAALLLALASSLAAHVEGREVLRTGDVRRLVDGKRPRATWERLAELDPEGPDVARLSPQAYASIVARVYGHVRRRDKRRWLKDAAGRRVEMADPQPSLQPTDDIVRRWDGERDPLELLWLEHVRTARAARRLGSAWPWGRPKRRADADASPGNA